MNDKDKQGSHKNVWYGLGRQRIEIPRTVLKSKVWGNDFLKDFHVCSLGYYPKAKGHYTYRKHGLPENFLFYCVDGHGWYQLEKQKFEIGPNEFFILPRNAEHAYGSDEADPWSIYWVHFGGEALESFNDFQAVKNHFRPAHIKNNGEVTAAFTHIYKTLELGYSSDNLLFAKMTLAHFINLFVFNARFFSTQLIEKQDCVDMAILYMQKHITENISLNELSSYSNYSVSRFSSLFKQKTGYAPIDYFMQMKIQQACQQLDFTDRSIKEVAFNMGFDDPYYFSKRFKQVIGLPPQQYRLLKKD